MPVDFSPASLNAVNYAMDFAKSVKASVTLLYVCQYPVSINEVPVSAQVYTYILEDGQTRMEQLKKDLFHKYSDQVKIYTEIKEGNVTTMIEELCNQLKPFAVVIGSHGAGTAERIFFGSNTLAAIRHLTWPLIVVPTGAKFTSISRIGLACDLKNVVESVHAEEIKKIVTTFHAKLDILHVHKGQRKNFSDEEIEGSEWLNEMLLDIKPEFHFMNSDDIEEAINEFSEKNNLDMLIVIPKKHGLLEGLLHKSNSKQLAMYTHVPVMSIHE
jgi:nucleotide-binding universal stress UspA family protein